MSAERPSTPQRLRRRRRLSEPAHENPFYIQATSPPADEQSRVLKHGDTFAVFDHYGDIKPVGLGEEGVYHEGTRFLSWWFLRLGDARPMFLSSTVKEDNDLLTVDLTNPDFKSDGHPIPRGTLHLFRGKCLWQAVCYERLRIHNYGCSAVTFPFSYFFQADFADIFEVRGTRRPRRGRYLGGVVEDGRVLLVYEGLDGVVRRTRLTFSPVPARLSESEAHFELSLPPQDAATFEVIAECERGSQPSRAFSFDRALAAAAEDFGATRRRGGALHSSSEEFNAWVNRAFADLHMMTTQTPSGPYPYAGVPWFSTPFGRDGILTALEYLWLDPAPARGVLAYLASTQADAVVPLQDAEPGKILHETRDGEMAALAEIPFGRYYGSVDATPLFVMLAGAYLERTADRVFIESIWSNIERALQWLDTYGDADQDGFVEYHRQSQKGLVHQGWKDSHDAIFHADGTLAQGPIALCEVQGYAYAARLAAADMAAALGRENQVRKWTEQALRLQQHFEEAFWCDELGTYALALDGDKRPCRVRTSNAGHCLLTGIASPERARRVSETLMGPDSFTGWGIRTVSSRETRYNPMSYHDGSVWPHDNALVAGGLARYGFKDPVARVTRGLFDASTLFDLHRMPELFCGFDRRPGEGPTRYPVACAPQAWSAGAVFYLLQACLGLTIRAEEPQICFAYPVLPEFLREVWIRNLRIGSGSVDLLLLRHGNDVGINVLHRQGDVEIRMVK